MPTLGGILYRALKLSIPSSESTKLLNLSISKKGLGELERLRGEDGAEKRKLQRKEKYMERQSVKIYEDLQKKGKLSSDKLSVFVRARVSWVSCRFNV